MKTVRIIRNWKWPDLLQQTPGSAGVWDGLQYTEAENVPYDYYLVLNNLATGQSLTVPPDRVFRVVQEPPTEFFQPWHEHAPYASKTFMCDPKRTSAEYIQSQPMVPWHINRDYDFLVDAPIPRKIRLMSWITSTKTILAGHRKRMDFLNIISGKIPGLDVLGTKVHHILNPVARGQNADKQKELGFTIVADKWEGLAPYIYSLAIENFCGPDYWTEKLADCFLAWTIPVYYGCTNLEKYFPAESFIRIDIEKPEEAIRIIQDTIYGNSWRQRLPAIMEARESVLKKYQLFPRITRYINILEKKSIQRQRIFSTLDAGARKKPAQNDLPRISVVVCTYNRQQMLHQCLLSLAGQTTAKKNYEILVVDNNSTDNTKEVAAGFFKDFPHGSYLFEPQQGLSRARNLGFREARGEYIAFIDDDSLADSRWLSEALKIIEEKQPDIFGGAVFPLFPGGKPDWFKEQYGIRGDMGESGWIEKGFIIGANIFFCRSLLVEYGGFNPNLGMNGYNLGYHEETELVYRAFKEKRKVYFSKELIVKDVLPDYKKSFVFFLYSKYRIGIDGNELWPQDGHAWDIRRLLRLIKNTMDEFNTALLKRDKNLYPYPENYVLDNNLLDNFITIGLMAEFFLRENKIDSPPIDPGVKASVLSSGWCDKYKYPLLSIIIANYNNESYLRDCLESILSQTYQNLELIIVDDNSTDASVEIIKEYENKYPGKIKALFSEAHNGVAQNRHRAALISSGLFLTTLDSDDYYYDSRKLEKEMDLLLYYKEKTGQDIVAFSNIALVNEDKTLICIWGNQESIREGNIFASIMGRSCLIPRDFVMSKDAYFKAGGFDRQINLYEDWDIKIRLAAQNQFVYTGINGTAYRRHGKGLSAANMENHEKWLYNVFEKNFHLTNPEDRSLIFQKFEEYLDSVIRKY